MKRKAMLLVCLMIILCILPAVASDDIPVIKLRLKQQYLSVPHDDYGIKGYLSSQNSAGDWDSIEYDDPTMATWKPMQHLNRLLQMAKAYHTPSSSYYQSNKVLASINKGLEFWYQRKPISKNGWYNKSGQQLALMPLLILMENDISKELVTTGLTYLADSTEAHEAVSITYVPQIIIKGCLTNSDADLTLVSKILAEKTNFTARSADGGMQRDYSYHQHGAQLYSGSYGMEFADSASLYMKLFSGTKYAFSKEAVDRLSSMLLDGTRWMTRGNILDYNTLGRAITRKDTYVKTLLTVCDRMALSNPARQKEFIDFKAQLEGKDNSMLGNKYFWDSDFITHQRETYYTSVRMVSARTAGAETMNGENLKGSWQSFGTNYIIHRGDEYKDIAPALDWEHLPGVTAPYNKGAMYLSQTQKEAFVGGVSNGIYGAAAMAFDRLNTKGKKAWFFFDKEFIVLGTGINSSLDLPIHTTLNQCLFKGELIADGKTITHGETSLGKVKWLYHDKIGYVFLDSPAVTVAAKQQSGSWHDINAMYTSETESKDIFTLWLDHGARPTDKSFAYVVVPGIDAAELPGYTTELPLTVIANTPDLQAVEHTEKQITAAVFYQPGTIKLKDSFTVTVNHPCMMLITRGKKSISITVSSPLAESVGVTITHLGKRIQLMFELPGDDMSGSSQVKRVTL